MGIHRDQQLHVIRHHLDLENLRSHSRAGLPEDSLQAFFHPFREDWPPVFWPPDDLVRAVEGDVGVRMHRLQSTRLAIPAQVPKVW